MHHLSWQQFDQCVERLTTRLQSRPLSGVYGVPRGGLCLAVALSHALSLPLLGEPESGCLVVDDVYETGLTLRALRERVDATFVVWVSKHSPQWWMAAEVMSDEQWLVFPWENASMAVADEQAYQASRRING